MHFDLLDSGREAFDAPPLHVAAKLVVLGAGSLGSTEILLRSQKEGLSVSDQIGRRFTGNGDVLAFAYNCDDPIHGIGWGDHAPGEVPPVGPCIAGIVDMRERPELDHGMVIEEGVMPGAISRCSRGCSKASPPRPGATPTMASATSSRNASGTWRASSPARTSGPSRTR